MTQVDDVECSLFDEDLTQVNDSTQLDDDLTHEQTQDSDDVVDSLDDDNPALVDDPPQAGSGLQSQMKIHLTLHKLKAL